MFAEMRAFRACSDEIGQCMPDRRKRRAQEAFYDSDDQSAAGQSALAGPLDPADPLHPAVDLAVDPAVNDARAMERSGHLVDALSSVWRAQVCGGGGGGGSDQPDGRSLLLDVRLKLEGLLTRLIAP